MEIMWEYSFGVYYYQGKIINSNSRPIRVQSTPRRATARSGRAMYGHDMDEIIASDRVQRGLDGSHCFLAHLEKVEKNLLINGSIYPSFGAHSKTNLNFSTNNITSSH